MKSSTRHGKVHLCLRFIVFFFFILLCDCITWLRSCFSHNEPLLGKAFSTSQQDGQTHTHNVAETRIHPQSFLSVFWINVSPAFWRHSWRPPQMSVSQKHLVTASPACVFVPNPAARKCNNANVSLPPRSVHLFSGRSQTAQVLLVELEASEWHCWHVSTDKWGRTVFVQLLKAYGLTEQSRAVLAETENPR